MNSLSLTPRVLASVLPITFLTLLTPIHAQETRPIRLEVDAREAPRNIVHARLVIPVRAGPLTLSFPKWIQGEHAPTGPVTDFVGFFVSAGGQKLSWKRDPVDMYSLNLVVPE